MLSYQNTFISCKRKWKSAYILCCFYFFLYTHALNLLKLLKESVHFKFIELSLSLLLEFCSINPIVLFFNAMQCKQSHDTEWNKCRLLSLKSETIYKKLWSFKSFWNVMSLWSFSYSETVPHDKKDAVFNQDTCNTHGYKCAHANIRIVFIQIMTLHLRH